MSFSWDPTRIAERVDNWLNRARESPIVRGVVAYYQSLEAAATVFAKLMPLGPAGWAISTYGMLVIPEAHIRAADVADTDLATAGARLEEGWSDPAVRQEICALVLYVYPLDQREIAARRHELLLRASENYEAGRYEEAVLLVYSQLDGLFRDLAEVRDVAFRRLFGKGRVKGPNGERVRQFEELVADSGGMIGTEHDFFLSVRDGMSADVVQTTLSDHPSRHGVLHGRVLGYGTRARAAKAFAFLTACLELLVSSWGTDLPLSDEEADAVGEDMPAPLSFILQAMTVEPVRAVYLTSVRTGEGILVTGEQRTQADRTS